MKNVNLNLQKIESQISEDSKVILAEVKLFSNLNYNELHINQKLLKKLFKKYLRHSICSKKIKYSFRQIVRAYAEVIYHTKYNSEIAQEKMNSDNVNIFLNKISRYYLMLIWFSPQVYIEDIETYVEKYSEFKKIDIQIDFFEKEYFNFKKISQLKKYLLVLVLICFLVVIYPAIVALIFRHFFNLKFQPQVSSDVMSIIEFILKK